MCGHEPGVTLMEMREDIKGRQATVNATSGTRPWDVGVTGRGNVAGEVRKTGRGERDSPATNDLPITTRLAEPPELCDWLRSA